MTQIHTTVPTSLPADEHSSDLEATFLPEVEGRDPLEAVFAFLVVLGTLYAAYRFLLPFA